VRFALVIILWVVYIGIVGTNTVMSILSGGYNTKLSKLDLLFSVISLFGLIFYVVEFRFLSQYFWKMFFVLWVLWEITYTLFVFKKREFASVGNIIIIYIILSPTIYAVYRYAFISY
jgi:hypothetical protein